jgi:phosphate/sulfate permease
MTTVGRRPRIPKVHLLFDYTNGFASVAVIFAALLGAILWNYLTWWLRPPTSSSHALIGGLIGAGLTKGGLEQHEGTGPPRR